MFEDNVEITITFRSKSSGMYHTHSTIVRNYNLDKDLPRSIVHAADIFKRISEGKDVRKDENDLGAILLESCRMKIDTIS